MTLYVSAPTLSFTWSHPLANNMGMPTKDIR